MKMLLKIVVLFFILNAIPAMAQDKPTSKEEKKNEVANARAKRKKVKTQWKETRKKEKSDKRAVRHQEKKLQTKATRKRMKKSRQKANRVNQNKKEFFLIRMFKPKPKTGSW